MDSSAPGVKDGSINGPVRPVGNDKLNIASRHVAPPVPKFSAWAGYYKGVDLDTASETHLRELRADYNEFVNAEDTRTRNFLIFDEERVEITDTLFRVSDETRHAYEQIIDNLFAGGVASRLGAKVLDRSDILDLLGYGENEVRLKESKVIDGIGRHALTADHWKQVPAWMENPVAVFDSDTVPGALVAIAPELINGFPVFITMAPSSRVMNIEAHLLTNAHERNSKPPKQRWLDEGKLRYIDEKKSPVFNRTSGLRLSRVYGQKRGSEGKLYTERDLVKYRHDEGTSGLFHAVSQSPDSREAMNRRMREEHHTLWYKGKQASIRYLAPGGLLPMDVLNAKIERDSEMGATEKVVLGALGRNSVTRPGMPRALDNRPGTAANLLRHTYFFLPFMGFASAWAHGR